MKTTRQWTTAAMLVAATGCYSGLPGNPADEDGDGGPVAEDGDADDDDADDGDGDDDGDPPTEASCSELGAQDLRMLTSTQYERVLKDLLPEPLATEALAVSVFPRTRIDGHFSTFATANRVNTDDSMRIEDTAEAIADLVIADFTTHAPALEPCLDGDTADGAIDGCIDGFIERFGTQAFRRPLRDAEQTIARDIYDTVRDTDGAQLGFASVVQFFLQAPPLLYAAEPGLDANEDGLVRLSADELAVRLGLLFLDGPPDDALRQAAASGDLETRADVEREARRLVQAPELSRAIATFHHEWLRGFVLEGEEREHPLWSEDTAAALRDELRTFATWFLDESDGRLTTLLTTTDYVPDPRLDAVYAENAPDPEVRRGLLTTAGAMASLAHTDHTSLIQRGVFIRAHVLCRPPPALPDDVDMTELDDNSDLPTARERLEPLMTNPTCAGCHAAINPLGFAFEVYDWTGAYRPTENGTTIDTSADLTQILGADYGTVADAPELLDVIAGSDDARDCYARHWFRYTMGRVEDGSGADECALEQISSAFAEADGDVRELLVAIATSDAFLYRTQGGAQ